MKITKNSKRIRLQDRHKCIGDGAYGSYYKLTETIGVKLVGDRADTRREVALLNRLHSRIPGIWPKCYGEVTVTNDGSGEPGILMEHIDGKLLEKYEYGPGKNHKLYKKLYARAERLKRKCAKMGVSWNDFHDENVVILKTRKLRFVDASPGTIVIRKIIRG